MRKTIRSRYLAIARSVGLVLLLGGVGLCGVAQQSDSAFLAEKGFHVERFRDENTLGMPNEWITLSNAAGEVLRFTMLDVEGDSNSEALELGQMELSGNRLVCYTSWLWAGDAPASPAGVRKSVYAIVGDGHLELKAAAIYIEVIRPSFIPQEQAHEWLQGARFIREKPTNMEQDRLLQTYIAEVEKDYGATFARGKKGAKLEKQVQAAMRKTIQEYTADWGMVFGDHGQHIGIIPPCRNTITIKSSFQNE